MKPAMPRRRKISKTAYFSLTEGLKRHGENISQQKLRWIIQKLGAAGRYSFTLLKNKNTLVTYSFWIENGKLRRARKLDKIPPVKK